MKVEQHVEVTNPKILLSDVMKVYSVNSELEKKVSGLLLYQSKGKEDTDHMFSILKVIEIISRAFPEVLIQNEGETEFIVTVRRTRKKAPWIDYTKVAVVSLLCFFGAAFSIMTFNEDASVKEIFGYISKLVTGSEEKGINALELSYSIGLPLGIILFYNHFAGIRVQKDPTPIQTQMRLYEDDVNRTLLLNADREGKIIDAD